MKYSARENYLKTIFELQEANNLEIIGIGQLASALGLSAGTITGMVKKLSSQNLLNYKAYSGCSLTPAGRSMAVDILRRHRILELFLVKTIGLDWADVHEEAERLEHAVSPRVLDGLDRLLGYPQVDPHGDPIPDAEGWMASFPHISLSNCHEGKDYEVARILDESREFLTFIGSISLYPGTRIRIKKIQPEAGVIQVKPEGRDSVTLGLLPGKNILVSETED
jgi:DtxR family transcriptional regulator, Mn-dependent transcriptional regulator